MGSSPYDRFGNVYNVTRVVNSNDNSFNVTAYDEYSPMYLTINYAMTYLLAFALTTCIIVHTALYHGPALLRGFKRMKTEDDDIHAKLMRYYPEVPDWWYGCVFVAFFLMGLFPIAVSFLMVATNQFLIRSLSTIFPLSSTLRVYHFGHCSLLLSFRLCTFFLPGLFMRTQHNR